MSYQSDRQKRRDAYSAKLRDPRWQKLRLEVLNRDEWRCRICGDEESTLHVHHRWYESGKEPWEAELDALVTLCETCHEAETFNRAENEKWLLQALKRKFFAGDLYQIEKWILTMPCLHLDEVQLSAMAWFMSQPENVQLVIERYFDAKCAHPIGWPTASIRPRPEDWNSEGRMWNGFMSTTMGECAT